MRTTSTAGLSISLGVLLIAAWSSPAGAVSQSPNPVKVNRCEPVHKPGSSGGYATYVPAYYPGTRYYWVDPYRHSYYQPPVSATGTLYIDYVNNTPHEIKTIDFGLVARGQLVAEVRDVGKFSPGVEIKHSFGISPNVFPIATGLPACVPTRITYADGTQWLNPKLPPSDSSLYGTH
jgi:hypothetical protein